MRIIPGNTKVKIEIFNGITLWDLLVAALAGIMLALIVVSTLPYKIVFVVVHLFITVLLLARIDKDPTYLYLIHIIRHYSIRRKYDRAQSDEDLYANASLNDNEVVFDEIFKDDEEEIVETEGERKARIKAEKEEYKNDTKLLKSKKLTKEEEDAIWLKRAEKSAAKKAVKTEKQRKSGSWTDMEELSAFTGIKDGFIEYGDKYYGKAIEISSVEFRFFSDFRRQRSIEVGFGSILRSLRTDYSANLVKIERPISYAHHVHLEYEKLDSLKASYEAGILSEEELKSRVAIVYDRIYELRALRDKTRIVIPFYYLVLFNSDKKQLSFEVDSAIDSLNQGEIEGKVLDDKELATFLKYTNQIDFDETDVDDLRPEDYAAWAMPNTVEFSPRTTQINGIMTHNFRVVNYPTVVSDAWLATLMTYSASKVVVKMQPMDSGKAINAIDKSIAELRAKVMSSRADSEALNAQTHLETLQLLLAALQNENESLLNVNIYVTEYDVVGTNENPKLPNLEKPSLRARISNMKKVTRRVWKEAGFRLNNMEFNQALAYIGSQVSGYDPMAHDGRGIPSNTVAACYPWVFPFIMDENGIKIGSNEGIPVFVDFFERNTERVNSNMVIVGKSGSGKSYATKSLLTSLAASDSKIFILDPENEYTELAKNLNGKFINVANSQYGRLNPFHILTTFDDEDQFDSVDSSSYATHLQFLEEFFKQILPDCDKDALEYLNSLLDRVYASKGITPNTDLSKLRPEDFPVFDDLYDEVLKEFQRVDSDYVRSLLRPLINYISKFSDGGRNSVIWNGPSSITTDENFTVFNFQSLLANRNSTIANAQMLLILKYIDNEIIKNRDYNQKYGLNRKIVVVIDEAHVFIDAKFPVALDFMYQLAKRIRKYNGMQIVITQNIKDFVGSEEIARKSTAIINACQYSFIFSLAPNDMSDLCQLYEKAGGINENEQEQIVQAKRGQAFVVMSPTSRTNINIDVPSDVIDIFSDMNYQNPYFTGEKGEQNWKDYIGDSATLHDENVKSRQKEEEAKKTVQREHVGVSFSEVSEAEYAEETKRNSLSYEEMAFDLDKLDNRKAKVEATAEETPSKTEEMLAELTLKLGSQSIMDQIKLAVREELDKDVATRTAATPIVVQVPAAPAAPVVPAATVTPVVAEEQRKPAEDDGLFDIFAAAGVDVNATGIENDSEDNDNAFAGFDIFADNSGSSDSDKSETVDEEDEDNGAQTLGSIFDFASLASLDDDDDDDEITDEDSDIEDRINLAASDEDDEDDEESGEMEDSGDDLGDFDVMEFLAQQAPQLNVDESDTSIEDFINGSETVLDVTLEQLVSYNKKAKKI